VTSSAPDSSTDPRSVSSEVVGRGSIYTLGTAAPVLAQLLVTPLVTRSLAAGAYGRIAAAVVVVQVTMILASLGFPSVITRQALLTTGGIPAGRSLLWRGSGLALGVVAAGLALTPLASAALPDMTGQTWSLALLAGGAFVAVENVQALLRAQDRAAAFALVSSVAALGGPAVGLLLLHLAQRESGWYLGGLVVGYSAGAALGLAMCIGPRLHRPGDVAAALRMGLPVLPHLVALYLATGALVIVATARFGAADAGRLQLALLVGIAPTVLVSALNNAWAPAIYRVPPAQRGAAVARTARDVMSLAAIGSGGVAALAPWLLALLADTRYTRVGLASAVAVVSLGGMLSVAYLANVHLVFASGRTRGLAAVTPLALGFGLAVAALAGRGSVTGLAWGYPATYGALAVLVAVLRRRIGAPTWSEGELLPAALAGAALVALAAMLPPDGWGAVARLALAATLAVAGFARLRGLLGVGTRGR
jgi:O-antigen/teichoic acid export membrane protein